MDICMWSISISCGACCAPASIGTSRAKPGSVKPIIFVFIFLIVKDAYRSDQKADAKRKQRAEKGESDYLHGALLAMGLGQNVTGADVQQKACEKSEI